MSAYRPPPWILPRCPYPLLRLLHPPAKPALTCAPPPLGSECPVSGVGRAKVTSVPNIFYLLTETVSAMTDPSKEGNYVDLAISAGRSLSAEASWHADALEAVGFGGGCLSAARPILEKRAGHSVCKLDVHVGGSHVRTIELATTDIDGVLRAASEGGAREVLNALFGGDSSTMSWRSSALITTMVCMDLNRRILSALGPSNLEEAAKMRAVRDTLAALSSFFRRKLRVGMSQQIAATLRLLHAGVRVVML